MDEFSRWRNKGRPEDNAWRDKKNEFSPFHKVLFIGNYSQVPQTVSAWKWEWHHFTSLQANINTAEVNVRAVRSQPLIHDCQTLSPCSLQTYFLHNLFPSSLICQCVHLHSNALMFPPWIATVHSRGCHWSFHWTGLCGLISVLAWMTLFLPDRSHHRMGVTTLCKCNVHIQVKLLFNAIKH